jgi:4-hydroxythreonine-4-phosphate dehydrogenase
MVRTSPDHGTAFGIAGRNAASPNSMKAAIELAVRMARQPEPRDERPRAALRGADDGAADAPSAD